MCRSWWRPGISYHGHHLTTIQPAPAHLSRRQDSDGPDVHGGGAVLTAEEHSALVDVGRHRLVVGREGGVVTQNAVGGVLTQSPEAMRYVIMCSMMMIRDSVLDVVVCLSIETISKDRDHKHVDYEADEERDGGLDEVIHVGLAHLPLVAGVDAPGLHEGAV